MVQKVSGDVLRKMIALADEGEENVSVDDSLAVIVSRISGYLTTFFDLKTAANLKKDLSGTIEQLLAKNSEGMNVYFYKVAGEMECFVFFDPAATFIHASWALERCFPGELDTETKPTKVDQYLAEPFARGLIAALANDPEQIEAGADEAEIELMAASDEPRLFVVDDELAPAQSFAFEAETVNEDKLGRFIILAPTALLPLETVSAAPKTPGVSKQWKEGLSRAALNVTINAKTVIARQNIDMALLANLEPGQVIPIQSASLENAVLEYGSVFGTGAVRSLDGQRALKLDSV